MRNVLLTPILALSAASFAAGQAAITIKGQTQLGPTSRSALISGTILSLGDEIDRDYASRTIEGGLVAIAPSNSNVTIVDCKDAVLVVSA